MLLDPGTFLVVCLFVCLFIHCCYCCIQLSFWLIFIVVSENIISNLAPAPQWGSRLFDCVGCLEEAATSSTMIVMMIVMMMMMMMMTMMQIMAMMSTGYLEVEVEVASCHLPHS